MKTALTDVTNLVREHDKWMEQAFLEAEKAYRKKEVPVGAVVVYENRVIGRGHNLIETLQDPTAHAEILAITAAANYLASWRLENASLYVTLEPCAMCAGAILNSRIRSVVFGASDPRFGACGSTINILQNDRLHASVTVIPGILQARCESILKDFFAKLRDNRFSNSEN
ncbi:MAG: tRNA adenosine(34) deaminase TadA [candidate division KSB1 bacterium]|nr:tRNA adenosine(34) deaminase TadA [candidate division KSB1 bacterium]MDZ7335606.1 tRNA adenosine(34) deaminase TadA [candidate division KSB1 bacterium]MDZ7357576.1 tRNA adenosine(34) deaminase TadA [candidate division KSB1 bacterium]MDZ7377162.1 tRNA adenosine(34) deaminase TadA [candidate division KSB1 bacterium]MDZ7399767.1 tRNA adenosine(34) deaminase TadA [candidate division KSB1 bacterium]